MIMLDNTMAKEAEHLAPYYSTMAGVKPYKITGLLSLLPQGNTTISNMLSSKFDLPGEDTIVNKLKIKKVS